MTRYFILLSLLCLAGITANAQDFRRFKVALGIPFAPVTSDQFDFYGGFCLEPAIRLQNYL